jgi:hypothetical protein
VIFHQRGKSALEVESASDTPAPGESPARKIRAQNENGGGECGKFALELLEGEDLNLLRNSA